MHEHVVAAVVGLNKAEALGRVEPLNCSGSHFNFSKMRISASCPHDLRAGLHPISAMSWGGEPVRRYQQGESIIRMGRVYAALPDIASDKRVQRNIQTDETMRAAGSIQPADLFLGYHALDVLGLALDAVTGTAVGLDRKTGHNGIDASLFDD